MIQSNPGQNPYNAIDPAIIHASDGRLWMSFGSFWNGIYLTELDPATGKRITPNSTTYSIARHAVRPPNAIEAPYIYEREGYYYLFVNWDTCCQGVNSTYNIRVGRSTNITGPYVDQSGVAMTERRRHVVPRHARQLHRPGPYFHLHRRGADWFGYHYYDGADNGASKYNLGNFLARERLAQSQPRPHRPCPATTTATARWTLPTTSCGATRWVQLPISAPTELAIWSIDANDYRVWRANFGKMADTNDASVRRVDS